MVTETWIKPNGNKAFIFELTPPGFVLHHSPRSKQIKGKTINVVVPDIYLIKKVSSKIIKSPTYQSFENISVSTDFGTRRLNLFTIY